MKRVEVVCSVCGTVVLRRAAEVYRSRRLGRPTFCSLTCCAVARNSRRRAKELVVPCPTCKKMFKTTTKKKAKKFCSRSCATLGSETEKRRAGRRQGGLTSFRLGVGHIISPAETLRRREAWKYVAVERYLLDKERKFQFEYEIGGKVFDLALLDVNVLVEFDGPYHKPACQQKDDARKEAIARSHGYTVVRRPVPPMVVIDPSAVEGL